MATSIQLKEAISKKVGVCVPIDTNKGSPLVIKHSSAPMIQDGNTVYALNNCNGSDAGIIVVFIIVILLLALCIGVYTYRKKQMEQRETFMSTDGNAKPSRRRDSEENLITNDIKSEDTDEEHRKTIERGIAMEKA